MKSSSSTSTSHTITTLPPSPERERRKRFIEYTIMMAIRVLCVLACIWVRGWWLIPLGLAAVFLPYFAVIIANTVQRGEAGTVERPGALQHRAFDDNQNDQ